MIHVLATIELKPEAREAWLAEFRAIRPLVLAEEGCLEYGAAVDVNANLPLPTPQRANVVTIVEKWTSPETLRRHLAAPHMLEYRMKVRAHVASVSLLVLDPLE